MVDESKGLHIDKIYNMLTCGIIDKFGSIPNSEGVGFRYYYKLSDNGLKPIVECNKLGKPLDLEEGYNYDTFDFGGASEWHPIRKN